VKIRARAAATSLSLILLVALALRLGYAWEQQRIIPHVDLEAVPFQYEPGVIAYSLAVGKGFSSPFRVETGPTAWETPVYPFIVAGIFDIFGTFTFHAFIAAVLLNILFSTLTCIPVFYAGKRIGGLAIGATAAWLWALFPNAIIIPFQWIWDTSLSGLLAASILWATLAVADSRRVRDWLAYGLLWGFALMTNATLLSGLPVLLVWMAYRARKREARWLAKPALAAGLIVLCCVPWTVRNYVVFHAFVPLRSVLGLQLWLGNNDQYRDTFPGWLHPIDSPTERAKYIRMGEIAYMRQKRQEAIHWMLTHPRREAELFRQRFIGTWLGTPHPWKDFLRARSLLIRWVFIANFLAALGALFGIVLLMREAAYRAYAVPLAAFPALYPFAFYLSQALLRYRYPIDPIVLLLAAIAAVRLFHRVAPRARGLFRGSGETFSSASSSLFVRAAKGQRRPSRRGQQRCSPVYSTGRQ
jgi:Dolichyl-phosphate-mannose-protein mannosyltransferase